MNKPATHATAWVALCALLGGGALLAWWAPAAPLDWQPGRAAQEPWRFVTAAWVHWSAWHLAANLAGTAVVAVLGAAARLPARAAVALAMAWPLTHAGLWVQPALAHYGGASGVLHAAVAIAACWLIAGAAGAAGATDAVGATDAAGLADAAGSQEAQDVARGGRRGLGASGARRRTRLLGAAIGVGVVVKVLLEQPWAGPLASSRAWDIAVAPIAHASGVLAGVAAALIALASRPHPAGVR